MSRSAQKSANSLAANLKRLQEKHGLSDRAVAKKAGCDHKTVGAMRDGTKHSPSIDLVDAVAGAFGLAGWQLLRPTPDIAKAPERAEVERLLDLYHAASANRRQAILSTADPADDQPAKKRVASAS